MVYLGSVMITHQLFFLVKDVKHFLLVRKVRLSYLPHQVVPGDIVVVAGDDTIGYLHLTTHHLLQALKTGTGQTMINLVTAFR
jgi:hypothetical protein